MSYKRLQFAVAWVKLVDFQQVDIRFFAINVSGNRSPAVGTRHKPSVGRYAHISNGKRLVKIRVAIYIVLIFNIERANWKFGSRRHIHTVFVNKITHNIVAWRSASKQPKIVSVGVFDGGYFFANITAIVVRSFEHNVFLTIHNVAASAIELHINHRIAQSILAKLRINHKYKIAIQIAGPRHNNRRFGA